MSEERNEIRIEQLEKEVEELKQALKELQINNKEECAVIYNRLKELEDKHSKMELIYTELKQDMKFYSNKILEIDGILKEIAKEIKTISTKLVEIEIVRKIEEAQSNEEPTRFIDKLLDSNNRALLYLIMTLCAIALLSFGAKMQDIIKLFIP